MTLRVRAVLDCPPVVRADPVVLSGQAGLDSPVRWVHVGEVADIAALLHGGELILTTGLGLGDPAVIPAAYIHSLVDAGACGLIVELSPRFRAVPSAALRAARSRAFPIVVLRRTSRFVEITEFIHRAIVAEQFSHLEFAQRVHQTFTPLSLAGAAPQQIIESTSRLAGTTVVLEDLSRHVVAFAAPSGSSASDLKDWASRSRMAQVTDETAVCGPEDWLTTPVGTAGQFWGRIVVPAGGRASTAELDRLGMLLERAAQALEIGRMIERDRMSLSHQAQGGLLTDLADHRIPDEDEAMARAQTLGLEPGRRYLPAVVHLVASAGDDSLEAHRRSRHLLVRVADGIRRGQVRSLLGPLAPGQVGLLIASTSVAQEQAQLDRLAAEVVGSTDRRNPDERVTVGIGRSSSTLRGAGATIRLAQHVAEAASTMPGDARPYYRSSDVRLRGLLSLMKDDPRLHAFAESELDRLLLYEATHGGHLLGLLQQFLDCGGNKAGLARTSHRSRPAIYRDLDLIERLLGVSLSNAESRTSLAVALLVHEQSDRVPRTTELIRKG